MPAAGSGVVYGPVAFGVRREVRAALLIGAAVVVLSILGGVAWGLLAPAEHLLVTQPGRGAPLTGESTHQFDGLAILTCLGFVAGVLSAVAAWRWRAVRGPIMQGGLLIGALIGAYAMKWFGEIVAEVRFPRPEDPAVGTIIALAPEVGSSLALVVQPLVASLLLMFMAAFSASEDLGTGFAGPFGTQRPLAQFPPGGDWPPTHYPDEPVAHGPDGSVTYADGTVEYPNGTTTYRGGTDAVPESRPAR
ncbi:DUF2567 domain-containing protein [Nocardia sp. NPDC051832]|uniref:DUF2567 domain-containing protein n=1 Tax=Nocardia sp. NPDC051832 TaxID=3155673 RepID=UPI003444A71C